jgi:hypothetical protein
MVCRSGTVSTAGKSRRGRCDVAFDEEYLTKILQDFGPALVEGPEPWRRQRMFDTVLALNPTPVDTSVIYQHPPCEYEVAESQLKQGLPWDTEPT